MPPPSGQPNSAGNGLTKSSVAILAPLGQPEVAASGRIYTLGKKGYPKDKAASTFSRAYRHPAEARPASGDPNVRVRIHEPHHSHARAGRMIVSSSDSKTKRPVLRALS
jgi:hypothetical protein